MHAKLSLTTICENEITRLQSCQPTDPLIEMNDYGILTKDSLYSLSIESCLSISKDNSGYISQIANESIKDKIDIMRKVQEELQGISSITNLLKQKTKSGIYLEEIPTEKKYKL